MAEYGWAHRRLRAALLPSMPGQACVRCGATLTARDVVHLDHDDDDRTKYSGWSHAWCNTSAGGLKAGRMRRATTADPLGARSRAW